MNSGGISISGIHTYEDFGAELASRNTGTATKKAITATVPYMTGFYDFSELYGAAAFEDREIEYSFEIIGTPSEVQSTKSELLTWLSQANDVDIYDDDISGYHFRGSFDSADWDEDESGEQGTLDVTFLCQPFLIANTYSTQTLNAGSNSVVNGGHAVNPLASGTGSITINGITEGVSSTESTLTAQLLPGTNQISVTGGPITLRWRELIS